MDKHLVQELDYFLGARHLTNRLRTFLKSLESERHQPLYRGMMFPKFLLKEGAVLEEWHGSSHWSKDITVSIGFAHDGYINDDYEDELMEQYGFASSDEIFVPVVFKLSSSTKGIDVHALLQEHDELPHWHKEQEVSFIGQDFVMGEILYVEHEEYPYYSVDVVEKNNESNHIVV